MQTKAVDPGVLAMAALMLSSCAQSEPYTGKTDVAVAVIEAKIPARFQGHWTNSLDNCDLELGDRAGWLFVSSSTVGSVEHMYPVSDLSMNADTLRFTTRFGDRMVMRELAAGRVQLIVADRNPEIVLRCPESEK